MTAVHVQRAQQRNRLSELDFRRQIVGPTGLATMLGWLHVSFRPAQTQHGWRTPVTGELGKGWPDLVLIHPVKGRAMFRELKAADGSVSDAQTEVLLALKDGGLDVGIWRPADLDAGRIFAELFA